MEKGKGMESVVAIMHRFKKRGRIIFAHPSFEKSKK